MPWAAKRRSRKPFATTGADYLLQVKGNQPILEADIQASIDAAIEADFVGFEHDMWVRELRGHGRDEERVCLVLYDLEGLSTREEWVDLQAIVRVCADQTGRRQGNLRGGPLHLQPAGQRGGVGQRHTRALGYRERSALGAGCDLPRG